MSRSVRKELRLTAEMVERIDVARGDVSFNRFVERVLEQALFSPPPPDAATAASNAYLASLYQARDAGKPFHASNALMMERQQRLNKGKKG